MLSIIKESITKNIHAIINDDKSQDLLSASWSPRRATGVVPTQMSIDLRPRKNMGFSSSTEAGKKNKNKNQCPCLKAIRQEELPVS